MLTAMMISYYVTMITITSPCFGASFSSASTIILP
jgi:hypothetical protein